MLNIMSLKRDKMAAASAGGVATGASRKPKTTAAQIRLQKDLGDMDHLPSTMSLSFPDKNDLFNFSLTLAPDEGFYKGGVFVFTFKVDTDYPHKPPKVLCTHKIYHPNIDLSGNVCLNILREDWKPVLNINSIMVGLQYLFLEPNAEDPLNKVAAEVLRSNRRLFERNVDMTMRGGSLDGVVFDKVWK
ncbi:hypothetical protein BASA50_000595 [Batrachochytrium salamandrivorans]|uniref:UBC core domain-containing protein n=1 Tax=Batrachochytrium salamandrivorans TaxID=1357716 RepID=A0ABQ8ET09_9FUNG|nr:hypothetical protein BASA62_006391 [Batrachochytrium salamandrivorans]KAH6580120.1 hypothetical protein BASA60_003022 [Batrachochytrium salamandrivorans]KAH6586129.1 hypothetical protein BASA50_000595 [Batrachochytrium salamandrivorans]KAH6588431.1 hypothetical protein BASA61_005932 [Batrachochytrium salamandrivorans]KAH9247642.1 hypothetical protein BASA81_014774 [Batrachochytrium salamandrivorans]